MPARIDPEARRRHVIDAALRLIVADGIGAVTLRRVAAEAELNIGSVRHFFDGHDDLLTAAAERAGERMGSRLVAHPPAALEGLTGEAAVDALQRLVEEVLPVDDERRRECIVILELIVASRTRRVFAPVAERMADDLDRVLTDALTALAVPEPAARGRGLAAVIGGLTIDSVTPHGALSVAQLRSSLRAALQAILVGPNHGRAPNARSDRRLSDRGFPNSD